MHRRSNGSQPLLQSLTAIGQLIFFFFKLQNNQLAEETSVACYAYFGGLNLINLFTTFI